MSDICSQEQKWSAEDFQTIKETQQELRAEYDSCVTELTAEIDPVESVKACSFASNSSEEAVLLRKNYGDDSIPEFLNAWKN